MKITQCRSGDAVQIVKMPEDNTLFSLGLLPGRKVIVEEIYPLKGPVVMNINGRDVAVGRKLARQMEVRRG